MKKILVLLVFLFTTVVVKAQTVQEIEDSMLHYVQTIDRWDTFEKDENNYDSLARANKRLIEYLSEILVKSQKTLKYSFKKLEGTRLRILSSEDKKFRIYCWYIGGSGSARSFDALIQYKGLNGSIVKILNDDSKAVEGDICTGSFFKALFTIPTKKYGHVYMTISNAIVSNPAGGMEIKAFAIQHGKLNDTIRLFKTAKQSINSISFYYDVSATKTVKDYAQISLSKDYRKLYIPVVTDEGAISSKYLVYKFDGNNYVFDKNLK